MTIVGITPLLSRTDISKRLKSKDTSISSQELMKMNVAWRMADMIGVMQPTSLAIGSGSTSKKVVQAIGELIKTKRINHLMKAVATSRELSELAIKVGLVNTEPFDTTLLYIKSIRKGKLFKKTIAFGFDGADEIKVLIDKNNKITGFYSIKGGGGAHTLEKIIARMTEHKVFVVDESKIVWSLGETFHLPIEVIPDGLEVVKEKLLRAYPFTEVNTKKENKGTNDFTTDLGNRILMAQPKSVIKDPTEMEQTLFNDKDIKPYLIDTGFFLSVQPKTVLVACQNGHIIQLNRRDTIQASHPFANKILR